MISRRVRNCSIVLLIYAALNVLQSAEIRIVAHILLKTITRSNNAKNTPIERIESLENDKLLRVYSTSGGIYKQSNSKHVRVHTFGEATKLVYDADLGILIFQNRKCVYVSALNSSIVYLNPRILVENVECFFYNT